MVKDAYGLIIKIREKRIMDIISLDVVLRHFAHGIFFLLPHVIDCWDGLDWADICLHWFMELSET